MYINNKSLIVPYPKKHQKYHKKNKKGADKLMSALLTPTLYPKLTSTLGLRYLHATSTLGYA